MNSILPQAIELQEPVPGVRRWQSQQLSRHHPVNSYLVNGVLIDPAADIPHSLAAAQIVVTHVQQEHIAGAAYYPRLPLAVSAGDAYLCAGLAAYEELIEPWEAPWDWEGRGNYRGHLAGARNERPPDEALTVARELQAGDEIGGLRILATPGHGKHALTYIAEIGGRKIAFCGDLICGQGLLWNWFDCDWDYGPQLGQKTLLASARRLLAEVPDVLLPAHGEPIFEAQSALESLIAKLKAVLVEDSPGIEPLNFVDNDDPCPGWRQLSSHLYQWKAGNCALLISNEGVGLLVDDGLCHWPPLIERAAHHRAVMAQIKDSLGLSRLETVIVTHFHGDHIYNIPMLQDEEPGLQVVTLDVVAEVMAAPCDFNLSAELWWYGTPHQSVVVNKILRDGQSFKWREYDLVIFHLAGQTYYHCGVSAIIDDVRVTFAGDGIYGWDTSCEPVLCYNDNEPQYRGRAFSIERLLEQHPDLLVCGHGSAIREPRDLLFAKRAAWRQRLAEFAGLSAQKNARAFFDPFWPNSAPVE